MHAILLAKDATETAFKKEPLDQFRVLHLAVHGFADTQYAERSALVLGADPTSGDDGLLQVREIIRLRLNAELTTLSACDTGVGKLQGQEGISNLVEAFPQCFRAKIDAHVSKTLESKPQLVQISSSWNSREGAPLGRNRYVELEIKKTKPNGVSTKLPPVQKPCDKMTEAIVTDGGKRGQLVKVCADPTCRVHHPNTPSPQQVERERAEERKRIEKEKLAITTRHRILATVLQRVSAPLKKADLLAVAHCLIGHLSYSQVPALAKRHKVEEKKGSAGPQETLLKQVISYDESEICRLLLEISLMDSAYQRSTVSRDDVLMDAARRYRVDIEKLQKAVAKDSAAKRDKKTTKPKTPKTA